MNNPNYDKNACFCDSYGNVTAKNQDGETLGNDIRNESDYRGYTIDVGIMTIVWDTDDGFFGKFANEDAAKSAIDAAISETT